MDGAREDLREAVARALTTLWQQGCEWGAYKPGATSSAVAITEAERAILAALPQGRAEPVAYDAAPPFPGGFMTADQFRVWRRRENLTVNAAAELLGIARTSVMKYEADGTPFSVGRLIAALDEVKRLNALFYPQPCQSHPAHSPTPPQAARCS